MLHKRRALIEKQINKQNKNQTHVAKVRLSFVEMQERNTQHNEKIPHQPSE